MSNIEEDIKVIKQAEQKKESEEAEPKNIYEKVLFRLRDFTGSETTAKLIMGLLIFAVVVTSLLVFSAIFIPRNPRGRRGAPTPTPATSPTPITLPITPRPIIIKQGSIDELILDIDTFDVEQKDLLPPEVDLEIGL